MNLTQRIGPLPLWVWGGLAAVGVWFFFLRGKAGTGQQAQQGLTQGTDSAYGLGFAQGQQAATASAQPASATATGSTITVGNSNGAGVPVWSYNVAQQGVIGRVPDNTTLPLVSAAPGFHMGEPGYLVKFGGGTGWVSGSNVISTQQGQGQGQPGQGGPARKHGIGSRSSNMWHDSHPLIGAPVKYPHYVRAVGGPRAHAHEIHRVARQAGVHPARIAMLNPVPTGMIRVA